MAEYLEDQSIGTVGTDIFVSRLPDKPDVATALIATEGAATQFFSGALKIERPNLQVLHRNKMGANADGYDTVKDIFDTLNGLSNYSVTSSARYIHVFSISDIGELGTDSKGRPLWSVNFRIERCEL